MTTIGFAGLGTMGLVWPTAFSVVNELLTTARALGYGERDIAAVFEVFEELAGVEPAHTDV